MPEWDSKRISSVAIRAFNRAHQSANKVVRTNEKDIDNTLRLVLATAAAAGTNAVDAADLFTTVRELAGDDTGATPFKYFLGLKAAVSAGATLVGAGVYFEVEWVQG